MNKLYMNQALFLFVILVLVVGLPFVFHISPIMERFTLAQSSGAFPTTQTSVLVQDSFPPIGKNSISNDSANNIWQDYPVYALGSYEQITNNVKYPANPDDGKCTPASMCGALYHDRDTPDQIVRPLPPVSINGGTRVGYFTSSEQLMPFVDDSPNVLY